MEDTAEMEKVQYSPEIKERTVKHVPDGGKSASKAAGFTQSSNAYGRCAAIYKRSHPGQQKSPIESGFEPDTSFCIHLW